MLVICIATRVRVGHCVSQLVARVSMTVSSVIRWLTYLHLLLLPDNLTTLSTIVVLVTCVAARMRVGYCISQLVAGVSMTITADSGLLAYLYLLPNYLLLAGITLTAVAMLMLVAATWVTM